MRLSWIFLCSVLLLAACGGETAPPDALAMAEAIEVVELADEALTLVDLEAQWMCDAVRFSYDQPGDVIEARDIKLAANGLSIAEYEEFEAELANSLELREAVFVRFSEVCLTEGGGSPPE